LKKEAKAWEKEEHSSDWLYNKYPEHAAKVGRRALTPPDPQLKGAWYPGGFNPERIK
jgi:hypothetical protein